MNQPASVFGELQKLYRIFLGCQIVLWAVAIFLVQGGLFIPFADENLDRLLQIIAVVYSFTAVIVGLRLFRRRLEKLREENGSARDKLSQYRSASLVQWALLEGAGIFSTISYLITGNWAFLGLSIMLLAIFGGLNPFKQKVMLQLRLSEQDVTGI